jgi:alkylation response protein AidB-like acyl-CoA dehydrogenase
MLVQVSVARELVNAAAERLAADTPGDPGTSMAASMAKSYACAAAVQVAGKAMQLHGGMGYTWESGIHVFLKRAALNRSLAGSPAAHRQRLARRYRGRLSSG